MYTFEKICERDIDFIIMRAFSDIPDFANLFLNCVGWDGANILHIQHSLTDIQLGESDITVIVEHNSNRYALLIENKIDAQAMPNQCRRYFTRGENGKAAGAYSDYAVFIVAPQAYLDNNSEAYHYPHQIAYETLLSFFNERKAIFDCEAIRWAIEKQKSKYTVREVPSVTLFWNKLYNYTQSSPYKIEMYPPNGAKGARSTWPQFRTPLRGTALFYKSQNGYVDLEFSGKLQEASRLKQQLADYKHNNMHWQNTGKSISLRINAPRIDFNTPFEEHLDDVDAVFRAVEALASLASELNDIDFVV